MEALVQMKCVACRGGEPMVTDAEVAELLKIGKSQQNARVQVYLSLNCFPPPLLSYLLQFQKLDTYHGMRYNPVQEQVGNLSRLWRNSAALG
jgi:hypothetical protein